mgnify:CR=1 FL=1
MRPLPNHSRMTRAASGGQRRPEARRRAAPTATPSRAGLPTDEQLLDSFTAGDRAAFARLVQRYEKELFHFLARFLGDPTIAEDAFQETFLQVYQSARSFDSGRKLRPWLFAIAANKARDLMRSQARRPVAPLQAYVNAVDEDSGQFVDLLAASVPSPEEHLERQEIRQLVQRTVRGMPAHLREILLLSYFHQFPYKQISDILSIPLGTVKSRLHAAVACFAQRWLAASAGNVRAG